nr:DUF1002 domain-containing protein [Texcoconibacillus texcoconensis]
MSGLLLGQVSANENVTVTLGADLSEEEQSQILAEMGVSRSEVDILYVENAEEHHYLGEHIPSEQIGSRAISSALVEHLPEGEGINVETNNINWVSDAMYANALTTAGVTDAKVYVTAPIEVSGTAGLLGLLKAYEELEGIEIPEENKEVANEELVRTAELADKFGVEEANELMTRIKEALADRDVETEEELRQLIEDIAAEIGIELTAEEMDGLVSLFQRMGQLDIDWDHVRSQLSQVRDQIGEFLSSEEGQNLIQRFLDVLQEFVDTVIGWFSNENESSTIPYGVIIDKR